jgi:hypothetical protein
MAQQSTIMFRCVLDGTYFDSKEAALLHMKIYHGLKDADKSVLRKIEFPA